MHVCRSSFKRSRHTQVHVTTMLTVECRQILKDTWPVIQAYARHTYKCDPQIAVGVGIMQQLVNTQNTLLQVLHVSYSDNVIDVH
jgi:hypothetical protein